MNRNDSIVSRALERVFPKNRHGDMIQCRSCMQFKRSDEIGKHQIGCEVMTDSYKEDSGYDCKRCAPEKKKKNKKPIKTMQGLRLHIRYKHKAEFEAEILDRLAKSLEKTNLDDNVVLFVQNQLDRLNQELEWLRKKVIQMDQNNQKMDCLQQRVIALEVENAKNKHLHQDTSKMSLSFGLNDSKN
jgi:hypothetical protein